MTAYFSIETHIFYDDAGHHHGSQYEQITAYKRQAQSPAWALSWALFGTLDILALSLENFTLVDVGPNLVKTQSNLLDKCLI